MKPLKKAPPLAPEAQIVERDPGCLRLALFHPAQQYPQPLPVRQNPKHLQMSRLAPTDLLQLH